MCCMPVYGLKAIEDKKIEKSSYQNQKMKVPMPSLNTKNKFNEYQSFKFRQATAAIVQNIGFTSTTTSSISLLSFLHRAYFEQLCCDAANIASQAGRDEVTVDNASEVFNLNSVNLTELHDYLNQVSGFASDGQCPLFPVSESVLLQEQSKSNVDFVKETATTLKEDAGENNGGSADDKAEAVAEMDEDAKMEQSTDRAANSKISQKVFPNFAGAMAKVLGFSVQKIEPPVENIVIGQNFIRLPLDAEATFTIVGQDHIVGPTLVTRAVAEYKEDHHAKKKRKKEKREKKHSEGDNEVDKAKEGRHHKKHKEKHAKKADEVPLPPPVVPEASESLKIPKIRIRIGPPSPPKPLGTSEPVPERTEQIPLATEVPSTSKECAPPIVYVDEPKKKGTHGTGASSEKVPPLIIRSPPMPHIPSVGSPPSVEKTRHSSAVEPKSVELPKAPSTSALQQNTFTGGTTPSPIEMVLAKLILLQQQQQESAMLMRQQQQAAATTQQKPPLLTPVIPTMGKSSAEERLKSEKVGGKTKRTETPNADANGTKRKSSSKQKTKEIAKEEPAAKQKEEVPAKLEMQETPKPKKHDSMPKLKKPESAKPTKQERTKLKKHGLSATPPEQTRPMSVAMDVPRPPSKSMAYEGIVERPASAISGIAEKKSEKNKSKGPAKKEPSERKFGETDSAAKVRAIAKAIDQIAAAQPQQSTSSGPLCEIEPEEDIWICPVCSVAYVEGADMVACDMCDRWFHWNCVGILMAPPENAPWYCTNCKRKSKKSQPPSNGNSANSSRKSSITAPIAKKPRLSKG